MNIQFIVITSENGGLFLASLELRNADMTDCFFNLFSLLLCKLLALVKIIETTLGSSERTSREQGHHQTFI